MVTKSSTVFNANMVWLNMISFTVFPRLTFEGLIGIAWFVGQRRGVRDGTRFHVIVFAWLLFRVTKSNTSEQLRNNKLLFEHEANVVFVNNMFCGKVLNLSLKSNTCLLPSCVLISKFYGTFRYFITLHILIF